MVLAAFWLGPLTRLCYVCLSCPVHQAEASRPPAIVRWRRSRRKPGRWLPRHRHRGVAPAALPSTVWSEGSQWGGTGADRRFPQDTLSRYWGHKQLNRVQLDVLYATTTLLRCLCCRADFPQERCPVVLAPLLYPEKRDIPMDRILPDSGELAKTMMESSLAEFMQEVGYVFCARWLGS